MTSKTTNLQNLAKEYPEKIVQTEEAGSYILKDDIDIGEEVLILEPKQSISCINDRKTLKAKRIKIKCHHIRFTNLKIDATIIIKQGFSIFFNQCFISCETCNSCALIDIIGGSLKLKSSYLHCQKSIKISATFSKVSIIDSVLEECDTSIIVCSSAELVIHQTTIQNSKQNGICVHDNSSLELVACKLDNIVYPSVYATSSAIKIEDCNFSNISQNGITFNKCPKVQITRSTFSQIQSSAISLSASDAKISDNSFDNILGNGVYLSDSSTSTINQNKFTKCNFPAIAGLNNCSLDVINNIIVDMDKSGVCVRNAKRFNFESNLIENVGECGISISDTGSVTIDNNIINNCSISSCESYNSSVVTFKDNQINGQYPYGLLVYSGGSIEATGNTFSGIIKAICQLRYKGSAFVKHNKIENHVQPYDGQTSGQYLFEDNGNSPSATNIPEEAERLGIQCDPQIPTSDNLCIRCHQNKRECYFQTCGHCILCMKCGEEAFKNKELCPLCRFPIDNITAGFDEASSGKCTICEENPANTIIFPCGHTGSCTECLVKWYEDHKQCPFCRAEPSTFKKIETCI